MRGKVGERGETDMVQAMARLLKCSDATVHKCLKGTSFAASRSGAAGCISHEEVARLTRLQS